MNLGNLLSITEMYVRDLDVDKNQSLTTSNFFRTSKFPDLLSIFSGRMPENESECSPFLTLSSWVPEQAQNIFNVQFGKLDLECDVASFLAMGFTMDCVVHSPTQKVVCVVLYVVMRRYLWVEALAVDDEWKGLGIGKSVMERLIQGAKIRGKEILLFAVQGVEHFYEKMGFRQSERFAPREYFKG
ncbi:hypothetical protein HK096_004890, partial [Nowakowskiella sp. JEL0078]